jgi:hypothetical protein
VDVDMCFVEDVGGSRTGCRIILEKLVTEIILLPRLLRFAVDEFNYRKYMLPTNTLEIQ